MDTKFPFAGHDEPYSQDEFTVNVSTLDAQSTEEAAPPEWTGPRCEKCNAPIQNKMVEVCRRCGWYASLGTYLEVDPDWETEDDLNQSAPAPQPTHLEVWMNLLPWWAWVIIGTASIVVVESVAVRLLTPSDSWLRTAWSFTQLIVGVLTFFCCHVLTFLIQAADDADMGMQDLIIRPLKVWRRVLRGLPTRLWLVNAAAAGLTATAMSLAVIGGLNYERLLDWGFEQPEKKNLMGAMMSQMQKAKAKSGKLEDSVKDLAGSQNLDETPEKKPIVPVKPRLETDCLILGYRSSQDGRIHTLLLGTARGKQLTYAGSVSPPNDPEFEKLAERLVAAKTSYPFLQVHTEATWVVPKFTCRVSYNSQEKMVGCSAYVGRNSAARFLCRKWGRRVGRRSPTRATLSSDTGFGPDVAVSSTNMSHAPDNSDELFVPVDAAPADLPAELGLSYPRHFPPPTATSPDGLLCVGGRLSPDWLFDAYAHGIFPWPVWDDEPMAWWSPDPRAVLELDGLRLSRRLQRTLRSGTFQATCDRDFAAVIQGCATAGDRTGNTWLTPAMIDAYLALHHLGHAHSIEIWHGRNVVGGTYGVALGGLFAAESKFYIQRDASKVALAYLVAHLRARGYQLLDVQQWTPHTGRLGVTEISRHEYLRRLAKAIEMPVTFGDTLAGDPLTLPLK